MEVDMPTWPEPGPFDEVQSLHNIIYHQFEIIKLHFIEICELKASLYRGDKQLVLDKDGNDVTLQEAEKWEKRANAKKET
jgi:hypothetical protein